MTDNPKKKKIRNRPPLFNRSTRKSKGKTLSQKLPVIAENEEAFKAFELWKSLPIAMLSRFSPEEIKNKLGFDDPEVLELMEIKTNIQFGEKYGIAPVTLSAWTQKLYANDPLIDSRRWADKLTKNLILSLYTHAMQKGNPLLFKLYFQVVLGWREQTDIKITPGNINFDLSLITEANVEELKKEEVPD